MRLEQQASCNGNTLLLTAGHLAWILLLTARQIHKIQDILDL